MAEGAPDHATSLISYLSSVFPSLVLPSLSFDPSHVMSRLHWFESLKSLFHRLAPLSQLTSKNALLLELVQRGEGLPLQSSEKYFETEGTEAAFSFLQVFWAVQEVSCREVSWDMVFDAMIGLGAQKLTRTSAPPLSKRSLNSSDNMLYSSLGASTPQNSLSLFDKQTGLCETLMKLKEERSSGDSILNLSHPFHKLISYPESQFHSHPLLVTSTQYITLAGNLLTHMRVKFPATLVALDLSYNQITTIEFTTALPSLRLLNVGYNRVDRLGKISKCQSLSEVFISHNRLEKVSRLCPLTEMKLLDAGFNALATFESIAGLSINSNLMVLRLSGNPIRKCLTYAANVRKLLPALQHLDPRDIMEFSEFEVVNKANSKEESTPPSPSFHSVSVKQNWGQVDRVASPVHFHEFANMGTISVEKSYVEFVNRLTPGIRPNGFWSAIGSARSSQEQGESLKEYYFPESPIRTSKKPVFKPRTYECPPAFHLSLQSSHPKRPKVPKLLLSKVLQSQV